MTLPQQNDWVTVDYAWRFVVVRVKRFRWEWTAIEDGGVRKVRRGVALTRSGALWAARRSQSVHGSGPFRLGVIREEFALAQRTRYRPIPNADPVPMELLADD